MSNICMRDNKGRPVAVPVVKMQSMDGLREIMRAAPERSAECWAEMQERHARVRAARKVIAKAKAEGRL